MMRTALILAAHGSRCETANTHVRDLADQVRVLGLFDEVAVAFHCGEPGFAEVLDQIGAAAITVVPLMTSRGYYSEVVLPRELARSPHTSGRRLRIAPPIGSHPDLARLVAKRIDTLLRDFDLRPQCTNAAIVGHGTPRNPRSRRATEDLAGRLATTAPCRSVGAFFLDESPGVEDVLRGSSDTDVIVIPFLIGGGSHGSMDIPERLGLDAKPGVPPTCVCMRERKIVLDRAVGNDPEIVDAVVSLAGGEDTPRPRFLRGKTYQSVRGAPSSRPKRHLRLGTRSSRLALWQARYGEERFRAIGVDVEIVEVETIGDRFSDKPIRDLPTSAPFADDIEQLLRNGGIDVAIHSLKDLATEPPADLRVAAVLPRGPAGEALVSFNNLTLAELPSGAVVGTSCSRRVAQLLAIRPDLRPESIRGAVDHRVRQVRAHRFDAAILATAGLQRLGLAHEIAEQFTSAQMLQAPGQGALVVQVRRDDTATHAICERLDDPDTRKATDAELMVLRAFDHREDVTIAAYATAGERITLRARLLSLDGRVVRDTSVIGDDPSAVATHAIERLSEIPAREEVCT